MNWYIPFRFNVNRLLAPYFSDSLAFRSLQARTGTLISGSTALQFFCEESWPGSDLDLYVPPQSKESVCRWVLGEGYMYKPTGTQFPDFEEALNQKAERHHGIPGWPAIHIAHIFNFVKNDDDGTTEPSDSPSEASGSQSGPGTYQSDKTNEGPAPRNQKQVKVVVAKRAPMAVILDFHSSTSFSPL